MIDNFTVIKDKGIEAVLGFISAGVAADIKGNKAGKKDVAVILSEVEANAAAVYTKNSFQAAPVLVTKEHLANGKAKAIVVNSGNANACTGEQGLEDAKKMAEIVGKQLKLEPNDVVVSSTGVIGVALPMDRIETGITEACQQLAPNGGKDVAQAILTTDLVPKYCAVQIDIAGKKVTIGGIAKGSGMIHPNMATMLSFVCTDCNIDNQLLQSALKESVDSTYNMISVDGDTSTNDMCVVLANGLAGNHLIDCENEDYNLFVGALTYVNTVLAKTIARDGEGATHLIEVIVKNANTLEDARKAAKAVIGSSLVKSAIFGKDANWGRVVAALGYSGADFEPNKVDIFLGSEMMAKQGTGLDFDEEKAQLELEQDTVQIIVDFNQGEAQATAWGCDLTYDYVKINADYRT